MLYVLEKQTAQYCLFFLGGLAGEGIMYYTSTVDKQQEFLKQTQYQMI